MCSQCRTITMGKWDLEEFQWKYKKRDTSPHFDYRSVLFRVTLENRSKGVRLSVDTSWPHFTFVSLIVYRHLNKPSWTAIIDVRNYLYDTWEEGSDRRNESWVLLRVRVPDKWEGWTKVTRTWSGDANCGLVRFKTWHLNLHTQSNNEKDTTYGP